MTTKQSTAEARPIPSNAHSAPQSIAGRIRVVLPKHRFAIRAGVVFAAVVTDIALIGAAASTSALIRYHDVIETTSSSLLLVIVPAYLFAAAALGCYRLNNLRTRLHSIVTGLAALTGAAGLAFTMAFAFQVGAVYSRLGTGIMLVCAALYLSLARFFYKAILDRLAKLIDPRVVVVGRALASPTANIEYVEPATSPNPADPHSLEQTYNQIRHADRVVLDFDNANERMAWANFVRLIGIDAEIIEPHLRNISVLGINHWNGAPTLIVARGPMSFSERALKRAFDLVVSVALILLAGPLLLFLMVLIKIDSSGPAIFAQPRLGRNNVRYLCYKLRTMQADVGDQAGHRSTAREDDRITRLGKFLRRTSLDELPQLWNVIRGDMSLVGPRPHALGSTAEGKSFWEAVPDYWTRHAIRPGITGLAQIRGLRGATMAREDIEQRVAADLEYINSWSIWLDIGILLRTIRVVIHRNAF